MKKALITGVTGQDGRHLAEYLLSKGYEVFGMVTGHRELTMKKLAIELPEVVRVSGDLADLSSLSSIIESTQPDEVYNLGALTFVGLSFSQPEITANVTGLGALRLLEAIRTVGMSEHTRFYQASSSEMFGKTTQVPQNEGTIFHPRSPYATAKAFAHYTTVNYRESYGMHASCGILFNHEGPHRGLEFVTRKITNTVAKIKLGKADELRLGTLEPRRDWGFAGDYVEAMYLMLQQPEASDYVIATGETHSVRDFVERTFELAGIMDGIEKYVKLDKQFQRPAEVDILMGDSTKAKTVLGWKPKVSFSDLVALMLENDLRIESKS
jgi:GDPmannose 4,6-dehydratase